jgi:FtsZ-interacting cell division protein ZipA
MVDMSIQSTHAEVKTVSTQSKSTQTDFVYTPMEIIESKNNSSQYSREDIQIPVQRVAPMSPPQQETEPTIPLHQMMDLD